MHASMLHHPQPRYASEPWPTAVTAHTPLVTDAEQLSSPDDAHRTLAGLPFLNPAEQAACIRCLLAPMLQESARNGNLPQASLNCNA
jgi:hypothetical protein